MTEIKFNVLIAEDEENIGNFISAILKTNGYKPIIATTGNQAIQCAESYWTAGYGWNRCDLRDQKMGSYSDHRDFCKEQRIRESKSPGCRSR